MEGADDTAAGDTAAEAREGSIVQPAAVASAPAAMLEVPSDDDSDSDVPMLTAPAQPAVKEARAKVPVTVVTGFLGSGKTTLLNHILTERHGHRIAVIENEFGEEIGIESLIAKDGVGGNAFEEFYELSNGCICCSVRDDLVNTLEMLLRRRCVCHVPPSSSVCDNGWETRHDIGVALTFSLHRLIQGPV
mgnify:CR=1 FL=1